MDRINIGRHRECILHIEKDGSDMKFLIQKYAFPVAEKILVCVGVVVCVLIYTGGTLMVDFHVEY